MERGKDFGNVIQSDANTGICNLKYMAAACFAGSDGGGERWATACSLIATARLNGVEPYAYLSDVLRRMTDGHPVNRLDDLLPWHWTSTSVNP